MYQISILMQNNSIDLVDQSVKPFEEIIAYSKYALK